MGNKWLISQGHKLTIDSTEMLWVFPVLGARGEVVQSTLGVATTAVTGVRCTWTALCIHTHALVHQMQQLGAVDWTRPFSLVRLRLHG